MNSEEVDLLIAAIEQICDEGREPSGGSGVEQYDGAAWDRLEQSGFTLVSIPTDLGGSGGTLEQAAAVTRAAGRMGLAGPLVETTWLAAWLLAASGCPVPRGPLTASLMDPSETSLTAAEGGWRLDGVLRRVPWADTAVLLMGLLPGDDGSRVVRLDPGALETSGRRNLAGEPRVDVICRDVFVADDDVFAAGPGVTPDRLRQRAALGRVVAMSGAGEQVLKLAVTQAKEREQFGRPLVRFQAVQQLLARLAGETAAVVVAGQAAVQVLEHGAPDDAAFAVSAAKASASASAGEIAGLGHQVLGALGFTMEHPLHRSTRRLWAWREEYGNEHAHRLDLGRSVLGGDAWRLIVGRPRVDAAADAVARPSR
jgi:acyl-CoA dehydrogenase